MSDAIIAASRVNSRSKMRQAPPQLPANSLPVSIERTTINSASNKLQVVKESQAKGRIATLPNPAFVSPASSKLGSNISE